MGTEDEQRHNLTFAVTVTVNTQSLYSDLDAEAPEVLRWKQSKFEQILKYLRRTTDLAYTEIRENYRQDREAERRGNQKITLRESALFTLSFYTRQLAVIKRYSSGYYWIMSLFALVIDLIFCFAYLIELQYNSAFPCSSSAVECGNLQLPSYMLINRLPEQFGFLLTLSLLKLSYIWFTGMFFAENSITFFVSPTTIYDMLMTAPIFAAAIFDDSRFIYVPYFLRVYLMIPHLQDLLTFRKQVSPFALNELTEKTVILIAYLWALIYTGVCSFNYFESNFRSLLDNVPNSAESIGLVDSFYFIVITFSTVGYGDILPKTPSGKIVIMILIFAGVSLLPGLVGDLIETFKKRSSGYGQYRNRRNIKFVVICGVFENPDRTSDLIDSILRRDPAKTTQVVLLSRTAITEKLKLYVNQFWLRRRVVLLVGSGFAPEELARVDLRKADAAFIIADTSCDNARLEDEQNTLRALAFDSFAPNTPIYIESLLPSSAEVQRDISTESICIEEFKHMILAYNAIFQGTSTFILNLLRETNEYSRLDKPWHVPYLDGVFNEINSIRMIDVFIGCSFTDISLYIYRQFQSVLIGVVKPNTDIVLNPGSSYSLKSTDNLLLIAHRTCDYSKLKQLTRLEFEQTVISRMDASPMADLKIQVAIPQTLLPQIDNIKINVASVNDVRCWVLTSPVSAISEWEVESGRAFKNHIILCVSNYDIIGFLSTVRSACLRHDELVPILIVCSRAPTAREFSSISMYPNVYFMEGNPLDFPVLQRANLFHSSRIVVMNMSHPGDDTADSGTIMLANSIYKHFHERQSSHRLVVELSHRNNVTFLSPTAQEFVPKRYRISKEIENQDWDSSDDDIYNSPMFSSGSVVTPVMLEAILASSFMHPELIKTVNALCGSCEFGHSKHCSLRAIILPPPFLGRSFGQLFTFLAQHHAIIPIGIMRNQRSAILKNSLSYVVTNPLWSFILQAEDHIFVIGRLETIC